MTSEQRPTTARTAMLQALGPAAVALQMAPSPDQILAALAAAGWAVVPKPAPYTDPPATTSTIRFEAARRG